MEYNVYLCRRKTVARQLKQASLRSLCTFFAYRNTLNMENRDLNRLKVVLAERNGLTVGWLRSFFDMTKSCALYFLCLCIRQYPTKKRRGQPRKAYPRL